MKSLMLKTALALAVASPLMASAESQLATGSASANARLTLQVVIPRVVFLAVGTGAGAVGSSPVDNTQIDTLSFNYSSNPADVGNGTATAAQTVAVRVFGNDGQITLSTNGVTDLTDPGGSTIPLAQIEVTSDNASLSHPDFGGSSVNVLTTSGQVTDRTANWSYRYLNQNVVEAGTYTAQVTYTAALP